MMARRVIPMNGKRFFNGYNACIVNDDDIVSLDKTITQLTTVSIGLGVVCRFRCCPSCCLCCCAVKLP